MWLPMDDDRYEISDDAVVRNVATGRIMKQRDVNGYKVCYITRDGKTTGYMVHRLVARAFLPMIDGLHMVDHMDRDKTNNRLSNLRWCNRSDNNRNRSYFHSKDDGKHHIIQYGKKFKVIEDGDRRRRSIPNSVRGVLVESIETGSDALGKIPLGAVVTEVNFQPVSSPEQAIAAAEAAKAAGKPVLLQLWGEDEVSYVAVRAR